MGRDVNRGIKCIITVRIAYFHDYPLWRGFFPPKVQSRPSFGGSPSWTGSLCSLDFGAPQLTLAYSGKALQSSNFAPPPVPCVSPRPWTECSVHPPSLPVRHYFEKPSCFSLSPLCRPHRILHQLRGQLTNCSHCHVLEACRPRQKLRKIRTRGMLGGGYTASSIKSMLPDPLKNAIIQEESNPTEHWKLRRNSTWLICSVFSHFFFPPSNDMQPLWIVKYCMP